MISTPAKLFNVNIAMTCMVLFCFQNVKAQNNGVIIRRDAPGAVISKHVYGHFAEHLGRCIYGGFYVGEGNTKIPNTNGVRTDVVEALKKLKIPNLRWPGGCF